MARTSPCSVASQAAKTCEALSSKAGTMFHLRMRRAGSPVALSASRRFAWDFGKLASPKHAKEPMSLGGTRKNEVARTQAIVHHARAGAAEPCGSAHRWTECARTKAVGIGRMPRGSPVRSGASARAFSKAVKGGRRVQRQAKSFKAGSHRPAHLQLPMARRQLASAVEVCVLPPPIR